MYAPRAGGEAPHVLEGGRGVGADAAFGVEHRTLGEGQRRRTVQYFGPRQQGLSGLDCGRPHEAGFHFHGDYAQLRNDAARRTGHADIQQGH